ncbi:M16 family metallopeptidase [Photobacterium angustum]|uniref:M16 family metallopeptidase n=1 Tax=Photobacterium angustum TaxID=661 RepID=UPI0005DBD0B9|nr:pitrilysin family protein [Photobacterium angustum]KJG16142.1 peptidase M16 [Photobacterium angustum]KJG22222.1 peptidase M16 [Photobacterium angustum]KJG28599.1 peptidase M16 [Photobacterium angustum]PSW89886.1 insulinase family protein [Photobacterium angustum]PSW99951.1 insulinase family protein [Photobacterium angustum]
MKKWILSAAVVSLTGCTQFTEQQTTQVLPKGVTLIEQVTAVQGKAVIPYSKYRLANGLTVILSPDHSDPLVNVDVTYHVGSAREQQGKSGFAHFFEHMMFQGSKHVGDQQHFKLITEAGGNLNGSTNRDRTNYFETVPANQLEKALWLESDRMGFLLDAVSQRKFEIQRDTVKNERAQNFENRPYGLIYEKMAEALYPRSHPYSWQPIGYVEDLDRVDVNDLKAFFLRWYGPNNATLTIGGDINKEQTLEWVNKYFGSIPRGPEVKDAPKQPVTLPSDRYITLQDNIKQPMLMMGWPTAYLGAEQQPSLDMLGQVIGSGTNSLLYQKLVKTGKAVDAGAFQDCAELACTMYVYAMAPSGDKGHLDVLRKDVMSIINSIDKQGIKKAQLDEIKGSVEASAIYGLQSVSGKVSQLAAYQTFFGNPNYISTDLANIDKVNTQSVMRAYNQYIYQHPSVTLSVVPHGELQLQAAKPNYAPAPRVLPKNTKIKDQDLAYRTVKDNFDRSVMPKASKPVKAVMPTLYEFSLANGIKVVGTQYQETPTISLQLTVPAGRRLDPASKEGLAELTAAMMNEGSEKYTAEQMASKLDTLGSNISVHAGLYGTTISFSTLTKNLPETMALLEQRLFHPAFKESDFKRLKKQMIEGIVYEHQSADWLAGQATREVLFKGTVFGRPTDGTKQTLSNITLQDVKDFYHRYYTPNSADAVVVGDITQTKLAQALAPIGQWQGKPAPSIASQKLPVLKQQVIWLVNKADAPQTVIRLVRHGMPFDATGELFKTQLANFNLAGNFNSRINMNLREDKGFTYGAGGYFSGGKEVGVGVYYAQVRADATVASIKEFLAELKKMSTSGLTDKEVNFMRLAVGQKDALSYETPSQKASLLGNILAYDLPNDFVAQRNHIVDTITKTTMDKLAQKWFNPKDYQIIVVGDAKTLEPQLKALDLPVHLLTLTK